jgi:hypothetical protein
MSSAVGRGLNSGCDRKGVEAVPGHLEEEDGVDRMKLLDEVFAYQEATDNKLWASTHKSLDIGLVFLI